MPLPQFTTIGDAVVFLNLKVLSDAMNNSVIQGTQQLNAHSARLSVLGESVQGGWANRIMTPSPAEVVLAASRIRLGS